MMQSNQEFDKLLPSAVGDEEQNFTVEDVALQDVTLQEVFDMDDFVNNGGLAKPEVAGFIVFGIDGKVRLVAKGPNHQFKVRRSKKEDFRTSMDQPDQPMDQPDQPMDQPRPPKVRQLIQLPILSIVRGSDCTCLHGGAVINICK